MATYDEQKGRAKEALGNLTHDRELQRQGKIDRASGKLKEGINRVRDSLIGRRRRGIR